MRVLCRRTNKEYTKYCLAYSLFQSPSSVWRTTILDAVVFPHRAISIHVLHVEDDRPRQGRRAGDGISIHVLRVEDDAPTMQAGKQPRYFNPRPPCGGRCNVSKSEVIGCLFQSTSSVWRTTQGLQGGNHSCTNFNPRPPCGGRRRAVNQKPHTSVFQSTSSVWRTTQRQRESTHLPEFQSTSSVWRTTRRNQCAAAVIQFQSTSSVWRTTSRTVAGYSVVDISIHVLRVEDDSKNREKSLFAFI